MPTYLGLEASNWDAEETLERRNKLQVRMKKMTQCHYVLGDTNNDDEDVILLTAGLPLLGSALRSMRCRSRKPKEIDTVKHPTTGVLCGLWTVECSFDTDIDDDQGDNNQGPGDSNDPTSLRPKRRWHTEKVEEIQEANADDGTPIVTTAGEKIIVTDEVPHPSMSITRYEQYPFNPEKIYQYVNHTNLHPFYGAPTGCALIDDIETEEETVNGRLYERAIYTIRFRILKYRPFNIGNVILPDGWDIKVPNQGYLYRPRRWLHSPGGTPAQGPGPGNFEIEPGPPQTFLDGNGRPKIVPLDEIGRLLNPPGTPENQKRETLQITVQRKIKADFQATMSLEF